MRACLLGGPSEKMREERGMKKTFAGKDLELVARYDPKEFGRLLRSLREREGKTQADVGRKAGVDQTYVSMIEGGKRDPRRIKPVRLLRLLEAYGVPKEEALALIEAWSLSSEVSLPSPAPERPPQEVRPLVLPLLEEGAGEVLPSEAKETVALYLPVLEKEADFLVVRARRRFLEPAAYEGDLVVVEIEAPYEDGDLVAAAVPGTGVLLGRYQEKKGRARLEALLPRLDSLLLPEDSKVWGVVAAVVRELR